MDEVVLTFEGVAKSYGDVRALRAVSFTVARNEIVALLGPNGAGKSTALEIAVGLRDADRGHARLLGESPRSVAVRRRIGVTPQETGFPDMLRVDEIVAFTAKHYRNPAPLLPTLERFGLRDLARRRAGTLSGGQARRVALALAFVGNPEFAVLDEPTTGLDPHARRQLWEVVRHLGDGRSILFTTHYLEEAAALATRILVINEGRLLFDGDPETLRERVGGRRVSYVGRDGLVTIATPDADAYVRELVNAGEPFANLEITRPSLEEAFLALTGGAS